MGLGTKLALGLLLLLSILVSAWLLAILVLSFLGWTVVRGRRSGGRGQAEKNRRPERKIPMRLVLGALTVVASVLALLAGGRLSVALLFAIGIAFLLGPNVSRSFVAARVRPVPNSVLLRSWILPFRWTCLVEVKCVGKRLAPAISRVSETILITRGQRTTVYVLLHAFSPTLSSAEGAIAGRLRRILASIAPNDAYLLPLDSQNAAALLRGRFRPEKIRGEDWPTSFETVTFDLLTMKATGGFLKSIGAYAVKESEGRSALIPPIGQNLKIGPVFNEALQALDRMLALPGPDSYSSFLAGAFASRALPAGESMVVEHGPGSMRVRCLSSPFVEMTEAEFRMVVKAYSDGVRGRPSTDPRESPRYDS